MAGSFAFVVGVARAIRTASPYEILTTIIICLLTRWILKGLYRVYFHPLSRFPGPKIYAFTRLPHLYLMYTGKSHQSVLELHRQYGKIVRLSPDELSFIHPDAWRDIYGHGSRSTQGSAPPKHWKWYGSTVNGVESMVQASVPINHSRMRRVFKPAFAERALKEQEPLFMKYVNQLIGNLKKSINDEPLQKFDIVKQFNFTTFDVMGDMTFGESLHMLDNAAYDPWVSIIFGSIKFSTRFRLLEYYPLMAQMLHSFLPESFGKKRRDHFQHSVDRVTKRLEKGRSEGKDLWDFALKQDNEEGLTRGEMDANASLFMIAGTETTATLLSGLTYILYKNPDKLQNLVKEVRSAFASEEEMSMETIAALPYLNACLREGLRLYPPVPAGLPHVTPPNGSTICGEFIPPATIVSAPHFAMYRYEKNFSEPTSFAPERWLGDDRFISDQKAALQPFSVGSRDCLGKNMAYHEMRLILTKLLYNFDYELCPESDGWTDQGSFTIWEKKQLLVKLVPCKV